MNTTASNQEEESTSMGVGPSDGLSEAREEVVEMVEIFDTDFEDASRRPLMVQDLLDIVRQYPSLATEEFCGEITCPNVRVNGRHLERSRSVYKVRFILQVLVLLGANMEEVAFVYDLHPEALYTPLEHAYTLLVSGRRRFRAGEKRYSPLLYLVAQKGGSEGVFEYLLEKYPDAVSNGVFEIIGENANKVVKKLPDCSILHALARGPVRPTLEIFGKVLDLDPENFLSIGTALPRTVRSLLEANREEVADYLAAKFLNSGKTIERYYAYGPTDPFPSCMVQLLAQAKQFSFKIGDGRIQQFVEGLLQSTVLKTLSLTSTHDGGRENFLPLKKLVEGLPNLNKVDIQHYLRFRRDENPIWVDWLPGLFSNAKHVSELGITNGHITGLAIKKLLLDNKLKTFEARFTKILLPCNSDAGKEVICPTHIQCLSLEQLDMPLEFQLDLYQQLPNMKKLQSLDISPGYGKERDGHRALAANGIVLLLQNREANLEELRISGFTMDHIENICEALVGNTKLKSLAIPSILRFPETDSQAKAVSEERFWKLFVQLVASQNSMLQHLYVQQLSNLQGENRFFFYGNLNKFGRLKVQDPDLSAIEFVNLLCGVAEQDWLEEKTSSKDSEKRLEGRSHIAKFNIIYGLLHESTCWFQTP